MCWWKPQSPFIFMDEGTHRPRPIKKNTNWCTRAYFYWYIWMKDIINFVCVPYWKTKLHYFHLYHFAVSFTRFAWKKVSLVHEKTWLKYCVFVLVCPRFRDQEENLTLSEDKSLHPHFVSFGLTYLRNSKNRDKDPEKRSSCADWPAQPEQHRGLWYWPIGRPKKTCFLFPPLNNRSI